MVKTEKMGLSIWSLCSWISSLQKGHSLKSVPTHAVNVPNNVYRYICANVSHGFTR